MTLNDWYVFAQGVSVVLLFMTFLAGAAVIGLGLLRDKRGEAERQAMDARIAAARERAAAAEQGTARANLAAASANERAAVASTAAAEANERAGRIETEAAQQRERAANAERQLLELQQRIANRRLSPDQTRTLVAALRVRPGDIRVSCVGGNPEPCAFAEDIVTALRQAEWNVTEFAKGVIYVGGSPSGLILQVKDRNAPLRAETLQKALMSIGVEAPGQVLPDLDPNAVSLVIGSKP